MILSKLRKIAVAGVVAIACSLHAVAAIDLSNCPKYQLSVEAYSRALDSNDVIHVPPTELKEAPVPESRTFLPYAALVGAMAGASKNLNNQYLKMQVIPVSLGRSVKFSFVPETDVKVKPVEPEGFELTSPKYIGKRVTSLLGKFDHSGNEEKIARLGDPICVMSCAPMVRPDEKSQFKSGAVLPPDRDYFLKELLGLDPASFGETEGELRDNSHELFQQMLALTRLFDWLCHLAEKSGSDVVFLGKAAINLENGESNFQRLSCGDLIPAVVPDDRHCQIDLHIARSAFPGTATSHSIRVRNTF